VWGRAYFPDAFQESDDELLRLLVDNREAARDNHWYPLPGQAEFLDLLRAVLTLEQDPQTRIARRQEIWYYALRKHQEDR